jgi:hypothetical protein
VVKPDGSGWEIVLEVSGFGWKTVGELELELELELEEERDLEIERDLEV